MSDFISTDDLAADICDNLPPLKPNRAMEDAAKGLLDTCLEQVEALVADAIEKAVSKVEDARTPPTLADLADVDDASGREVGAMVSECPHLHRQIFLRGFLDGLDKMALDDLHAELMRR